MFDGIPFRGSGRVMRDRNGELEFIGELVLQKVLPGAGSASVAAAAVSQDTDFVCLWVTVLSLVFPPSRDAVYGELRRDSPT